MHINIKTINFRLTDHTRDYIFKKMKKIGELTKNIKFPWEIHIEIGRTTQHHKKGDDLFKCEANLKLGNAILRAEAREWDIKAAINTMRDNLEREIRKFKGKKSAKYKKGARIYKKIMRMSPLAGFWRGEE